MSTFRPQIWKSFLPWNWPRADSHTRPLGYFSLLRKSKFGLHWFQRRITQISLTFQCILNHCNLFLIGGIRDFSTLSEISHFPLTNQIKFGYYSALRKDHEPNFQLFLLLFLFCHRSPIRQILWWGRKPWVTQGAHGFFIDKSHRGNSVAFLFCWWIHEIAYFHHGGTEDTEKQFFVCRRDTDRQKALSPCGSILRRSQGVYGESASPDSP